jgi:predicted DCC family thiol-disulfide oxidoreductase YuxK
VWLLAAAAGEGLAHRQLIASDPRQAATFLQLALDKGLIQQSSVIAEQQQADVLLWAFNEARELLKEHSAVFEALRKRLETGGATVGECVSLIEKHRG